MNIRAALKTVLLPVCLETTTRMREKFAERALADNSPIVERAKYALKLLKKAGWPSDIQTTVIIEGMVAIAHGREGVRQLKASVWSTEDEVVNVVDPLTVIRHKEHEFPYIVEHGAKRRMLNRLGTLETFNMDSYMVASDEDVERCIDELTEDQIRFIFSNRDVFAPILASLLSPPRPQENEPPAGIAGAV